MWGLLASKLLTSQRLRRLLPIAAIAGFVCAGLFVALIAGAIIVLQQQQQQSQCGTSTSTSATAISSTGSQEIPPALIPIYQQAAAANQLGPDGWAWLAAINRVETDFGRDLSVSTAGAIGWMQFEPATWATYGAGGDPYKPQDAINATARYLHALGAPADWQGAVRAYNGGPGNARSPVTLGYWQQASGLEQSYIAAGSTSPVMATLTVAVTPAAAQGPQITLRGGASTYGNDPLTSFVDGLDNNRPALAGASNDTPGIAVLNTQTLGGWWEVRAPNGRVAILQQTDYGPSAAGRIVDINAVAARTVFGLPQGNAFPTGQGTWTVRFLGRQRPANAATAAQGAAAATTAVPVAAASCMPCPDTAPAAAGTLALAPQVDPAGVPNARGGAGFTPGPGTDYSVGEEPQLASHLDALGRALGIRLTGISGYRSPQHSVAVGGFGDDPHTRGEASDTDGAQTIPEATLEQFGLTRPFPGAHEADHIQLRGSAGAGVATLVSAGQVPSSACQSGGAVPLAPGDRARILPSGLAEAPANAPPAVKAMIAAGNQLIGLPYLWGGGHGTFDLAADKTGVDCSGAVSWLLHAGGLLATPWDSTTLEGFQAPGSGLWVTIFANSGHTFLYVAGIRMDTAPQSGDGLDSQDGPRWRPATRSTAGFVARHPAAL